METWKSLILLHRFLAVGVDEQRSHLGGDALHRELGRRRSSGPRGIWTSVQRSSGPRGIWTSGIWTWQLFEEFPGLVDDAVGRGRECEDVLDQGPLVVGQLLPVGHVQREADLTPRPSKRLYAHIPAAAA